MGSLVPNLEFSNAHKIPQTLTRKHQTLPEAKGPSTQDQKVKLFHYGNCVYVYISIYIICTYTPTFYIHKCTIQNETYTCILPHSIEGQAKLPGPGKQDPSPAGVPGPRTIRGLNNSNRVPLEGSCKRYYKGFRDIGALIVRIGF